MRVSGPETTAIARHIIDVKRNVRPHVATLVTVKASDGGAIDRAIAIRSFAPHSYTGEDMLELQLHGSPLVVQEVLRSLVAAGARYAQAGEFTRRAFLAGKIDLQGVTGIADLIAAQTRAAARAALANVSGTLATRLRGLRAQLRHLLESLSGAIDFPDEVETPLACDIIPELRDAIAQLRELLRDGQTGRLLRDGMSVAIVGPPNAGKSSLLNALLGEDRAIVSDIAGTTRDTIEESIAVDGVAVRLVDTAGIRAHSDRLEAAGIERTRRALESADVALVVIDGSAPLEGAAQGVLAETAVRPRVVFVNKADLGNVAAAQLDGVVDVRGCVYDGQTIAAVREAIARAGWGGGAPDLARPYLGTAYELDAAAAAGRALTLALETLDRGDPVDLIAGELRTAVAELGHMSADEAADEVLTAVFDRFCIGK